MSSKGTIYRKVDLHIHTPVSKCYVDKKVTAAQIVEEAIKKGLDVIAITDHNDVAAIEEIRNEAKRVGIVVLPGIEVSTKEAHLLALFDPDYPMEKLEEFLPVIGILKEHRGKDEAMATSFEKVLAKVKEFGGISIAAHANSDNGLMAFKRGTYKQQVCKNADLCALELSKQDQIQNWVFGRIPNYPAKACVCGSDAHSLTEIGQKYTYLKMDIVTINSLKHALADWHVRVKFSWDFIESKYPIITNMTVTQGFFKGVTFDFHPNLTCLVGGTGTGKSTVIEFLRYCFNDLSSFQEISDDTYGKVEKLIGPGGKVTVMYLTDNRDEILITREVNDPRYREEANMSVIDKDGNEVLLTNKPVFFSQGEIIRIAMNPVAQLELIDRYIDIASENYLEQELTQKLETNASQLVETINALNSLREELNDPEKGKGPIEKERNRLQDQLKKPIFAEFPKWETENRFINATIEGITNSQQASKESLKSVTIEDYFPKALDDTSPNYTNLSKLNDAPKAIQTIVSSIQKQLDKEVDFVKAKAEKIGVEWEPLFSAKKSEYEQYLAQLGAEDITRAQKLLRALNTRLGDLEEIEKRISSNTSKEYRIQEERNSLLEKLAQARHDRLNKRKAKAIEWENKLEHRIKIDIEPESDVSGYLQELLNLTTGSNAHKASVKVIAQTVKPVELVKAILNDDISIIQEKSGVDVGDIKKMVDWLKRQLAKLLELETVKVSDFPRIGFEVEPGQFKPINELATGTKSIVIVSIAMVEGNYPLVIDQPEDSLNTEFIYNQIVSKLRNEKESRQFIFASHNPNIVVSGETDLTHVLAATASQGEIRSSGGIDHPDTNKFLLLHLEGGPDAFKLRTCKYQCS